MGGHGAWDRVDQLATADLVVIGTLENDRRLDDPIRTAGYSHDEGRALKQTIAVEIERVLAGDREVGEVVDIRPGGILVRPDGTVKSEFAQTVLNDGDRVFIGLTSSTGERFIMPADDPGHDDLYLMALEDMVLFLDGDDTLVTDRCLTALGRLEGLTIAGVEARLREEQIID